jgi:hypothetical protein
MTLREKVWELLMEKVGVKIPIAVVPTEVYCAMALADHVEMLRKQREDQTKWNAMRRDIELVGSVVGWPVGFSGLHVMKEWLGKIGGGN